MLIKNISFPVPNQLEKIPDIEDNNIDVCVELEDGYTHTVIVATSKNLLSLMDKDKMNFLEPGCPFIIVKRLTKEIIEETIKAYAEDNAYWLKFHNFAGELDMTVFDKLQVKHIEELKELSEFDDS